MKHRLAILVSFLTLPMLSACDGSEGPEDAGSADAAPSMDSGLDAGFGDLGLADAGFEADAAAPLDAGPPSLSPSWSEMAGTPPIATPGRWGGLMAWVPEDRRMILTGGSLYPYGEANDTWLYDVDTGTWSELVTTDAPAPRYCHCGAYLPETRQLLIVNGRDINGAVPTGAYLLDLNTSAWTRVSGEIPEGGVGCMAVHDPIRERAIVFGGVNRQGAINTTWAFDPVEAKFTRLAPASSPPARRDGNLVYDPSVDQILLFGGQTGRTSHLGDVWAFDGVDWSELPSVDGPSPRRWSSSAIDAYGRWMVFGGTNEQSYFDDLWMYDTTVNEWTSVNLDEPPEGRSGAAHAFFPDDDALILFGGLGVLLTSPLEDGWELRWHRD